MASFSPISSEESSPEGDRKCCGKSQKCSKETGHLGKCDSKRQVNRAPNAPRQLSLASSPRRCFIQEGARYLGFTKGDRCSSRGISFIVWAWDFLAANASNENMGILMSNYKRGRFLQGFFERAVNDYQKSEEVPRC
ncbi:hypothetical protein pdam_00018842 [Pocillopora damicornis]|uniref:Uncharacterized protein n=1 Tax=Pocillopora damicornis TaxID=46731 RepID=A0A3M6UZ30_POCDA|nr:hypothetical protein pdam_00018842 [Pocillopora damicornis]